MKNFSNRFLLAPAADGGQPGGAPGSTTVDQNPAAGPAVASETVDLKGGAPDPGKGASDGGAEPDPVAGSQVEADKGGPAGDDKGSEGDKGAAGSDDWRARVLKGQGIKEGTKEHKKMAGQLDRYMSEEALIKAGFDAQLKISKGEISAGLPKDATDDQIAAYREENGIPSEASGYELKLSEGLTLGGEDERIMKGVFDAAHVLNIPSDAMSAMTEAVLKGRIAEGEHRAHEDSLKAQEARAMLKETWGSGDFQTNMGIAERWIDNLPEAIREPVKNSRMAGGTPLMSSPEFLHAIVTMERQRDPSATIVPSSDNPMKTINDEIAGCEKRMRDDEDGWHADTAAQTRYRELLSAKSSLTKKAG